MATVRGMMTAHTANPETLTESPLVRAAKERRPQPKAAPVPRAAAGEDAPLKGAARFLTTNGIRGLTLKIALLPAGTDEEDDARTLKAIDALRSDRIRFRPVAGTATGAFITTQPAAANWLRGRIAAGRVKGVIEDMTLIDIRCPKCDREFANTRAGQTALAAHIAEEHAE